MVHPIRARVANAVQVAHGTVDPVVIVFFAGFDQQHALAGIGTQAIGEKAGVYGEGWQATWKQNKPTVKTDWEAVAEVAKAVAPETYELALKTHTVEKPGARVFRFKTEEVDK